MLPSTRAGQSRRVDLAALTVGGRCGTIVVFAEIAMTGASAVRRTTTTAVIAAALAATVACSACSPAAPPTTSPSATAPTADGGDAAALDTGPYATTPTHPFGTAGDNATTQSLLESQRLAAVTVGPWTVNPKLIQWGSVQNAAITGPIANAEVLRNNKVLFDPLPDIAARNGLMAGFSTVRLAPAGGDGEPKFWGLQTVVLRFPDPAAAATAAAQLAAADPGLDGDASRTPVTLSDPAARAVQYVLPDGTTGVRAFTPYQSFVLYQSALITPNPPLGLSAKILVFDALADQQTLLKGFTPTPADKLAELPLDPSGFLLARTLDNPGGATPAIIGTWSPTAWLNFEDTPPQAATWLADAGVDWVSQRLATVYRARNAEAADRLLETVVADLRTTPLAKPAAAVPGLPRARCFERPEAEGLAEAAQTWQRIAWRFKCAASTDRYVFTVYAADGKDAQQRISAQWRILAGR